MTRDDLERRLEALEGDTDPEPTVQELLLLGLKKAYDADLSPREQRIDDSLEDDHA